MKAPENSEAGLQRAAGHCRRAGGFLALLAMVLVSQPVVRGEAAGETLTVAVVASTSVFGDVTANLAHFEQIITEAAAAGARLVCFPELALVGYSTHPDVLESAERIPGPATDRLASIAARRNIYISVGMAEHDGARHFITQIFVGPAGYLGKYRKSFPTPKERACGFTPGQEYPVWDVDGFRFGIVICADGRQEETIMAMKKAGVDVIHHPHGNYVGRHGRDAEEWTRSKVVYLAPRAIIARAHTLVSNSAGDMVEPTGTQQFSSGAVVIDALGQIVCRTGQRDRAERWILTKLAHPLDVIPPGELRRLSVQDATLHERIERRAKTRAGSPDTAPTSSESAR